MCRGVGGCWGVCTLGVCQACRHTRVWFWGVLWAPGSPTQGTHRAWCPPGVSVHFFPEFLCPPPWPRAQEVPKFLCPSAMADRPWEEMLVPREGLGDSDGAGGILWIHPSFPVSLLNPPRYSIHPSISSKIPQQFLSLPVLPHTGLLTPFGKKNIYFFFFPFLWPLSQHKAKPVQALFPILVEK